jgi:CHAD domain-containing protein
MSLPAKRARNLSENLGLTIARLQEEVSPKSVHRLRSTIRRIESLVEFAHPDLGRKQRRALEHLPALRKRAGKVRDLDVQMDLLGTIANGSTASDRRELKDSLKRKRARQAQHLKSDIDSLRRSKFLAHVQRATEKAGSVSTETSASPFEEARRQLSCLAAEFGSQQPVEPRLLHKVRVRMKKIRYLAETDTESTEQQRMLKSLKAAQDALGAWHDWEELASTAEKFFRERLNCPLLMEIRALFAARYADATAAVSRWFLPDEAPARSQPKVAAAPAAMARSA